MVWDLFLLQILLLLMQEFQYDGEHYQPLLYLFGKKYGKNAFMRHQKP